MDGGSFINVSAITGDNCLLTRLPSITGVCVVLCACVVIPFILDVRPVDAPAGVTQEKGRT